MTRRRPGHPWARNPSHLPARVRECLTTGHAFSNSLGGPTPSSSRRRCSSSTTPYLPGIERLRPATLKEYLDRLSTMWPCRHIRRGVSHSHGVRPWRAPPALPVTVTMSADEARARRRRPWPACSRKLGGAALRHREFFRLLASQGRAHPPAHHPHLTRKGPRHRHANPPCVPGSPTRDSRAPSPRPSRRRAESMELEVPPRWLSAGLPPRIGSHRSRPRWPGRVRPIPSPRQTTPFDGSAPRATSSCASRAAVEHWMSSIQTLPGERVQFAHVRQLRGCGTGVPLPSPS